MNWCILFPWELVHQEKTTYVRVPNECKRGWRTEGTPSFPLLSMGRIEVNYALMLNWIAWDRIALTLKLPTFAKMNYSKLFFKHRFIRIHFIIHDSCIWKKVHMKVHCKPSRESCIGKTHYFLCRYTLPNDIFLDGLPCTLMILALKSYILKPILLPNPCFEKF